MIPLVMDLAVKKKGWFSEEEMLECLTISQSLPGGIIVNMGSFIGKRLCGTPGMLMAAIGAVFPTATLAVIVGVFLGGLDNNAYALGAMQGAKAAAVAIVIITFFRLGSKTLNKSIQWIAAVAVIVLIIVLNVSPIWLILAGAGLGLLVYYVQRKRIAKENTQKEDS
jgi:Chromate transport protein ChrA